MISPHCDTAGMEERGVVGMDICRLAGFTEAILSCILMRLSDCSENPPSRVAWQWPGAVFLCSNSLV